ncbi:hypothetical protein RN001_014235 [Aquatica leii]|uniref:Nucleolar complex protein 2 homolog n=1 Tax=Aquatica leii TaxID=1421715 RepID=A0AAN7SP12_9COLE|nr:hypothetical protein RN001_014235 [Aquatica leii]
MPKANLKNKPKFKAKNKLSHPQKSKTKKFVKKSKPTSIDEFIGKGSDNEDTEPLVDDKNPQLWGENDEALDEGNSNEYEDEIKSHQASLQKLKETDPDFYKFLQENDKKLLQFNISDDEGDDDDEVSQPHKPDVNLEVASDESDFEGDDDHDVTEDGTERVITLRMLKKWQGDLQTDTTKNTIADVIQAFHAALLRVSNEEDEESLYKVDGSSVFNGVIQLCVLELSPAIRRFLGLKSSKLSPHKCKKFVKVKGLLQMYFTDLLKILGGVTSANILTVLLKHLHQMLPLLQSYRKSCKLMVKKLIYLWGTSDDVVRILSFFCILRITTTNQLSLLDTVLKSMYMTYVVNSKFVSVNTLSCINFMRRSFIEMFALDPNVSYQHIFLYIRQLAIHLRNAITVHKTENIQTVYNWQYINSLKLFGTALAANYDKTELQPLVYPFIQVCLGTIKLLPTAQYLPLRFQVVQILIEFSRTTGVFVPILPFILEVLTVYDYNKKAKNASKKPLNLTCLLRFSNIQMSESGFKDSIIDQVYASLLEYLESQSHSIAFPDLSLFCIIQLKQFISKCTVPNYIKKMKQILEKIQQNNEFIEKERKSISFKLSELDRIAAWETIVKNKRTPLSVFYESWDKLRTIKKNKEMTNTTEIGDYNLPVIKKLKRDNSDGQGELFPSDSESGGEINFGGQDDDDVPVEKVKKKKKKKASKKVGAFDVDDDLNVDEKDTVEDINIADW